MNVKWNDKMLIRYDTITSQNPLNKWRKYREKEIDYCCSDMSTCFNEYIYLKSFAYFESDGLVPKVYFTHGSLEDPDEVDIYFCPFCGAKINTEEMAKYISRTEIVIETQKVQREVEHLEKV
jgi:hypothetical protein